MWYAIRPGMKYHTPKHGHKWNEAICGVSLQSIDLVGSDDPAKKCTNCTHILALAQRREREL